MDTQEELEQQEKLCMIWNESPIQNTDLVNETENKSTAKPKLDTQKPKPVFSPTLMLVKAIPPLETLQKDTLMPLKHPTTSPELGR